MGNSRGFSMRTVHIDAAPAGDHPGDGWRRAMEDAPWLTVLHRKQFESLHADAARTQTTILRGNHDEWDSMSSYMAEMGRDESARLIMAAMRNGSVAFTRRSRYEAEEALEMERPVTLFVWERPLVRLGSHVVIGTTERMDETTTGQIDEEFGRVVFTRIDDDVISFLTPGIQRYVAQRIGAIVGEECVPWTTRSHPMRTRIANMPQKGEKQ